MNITRLSISIILLALFTIAGGLHAELLKPGNPFPAFEANDQHEKAYPMPEGTKFVAVTFAMSPGKKANKFFSEKGADYLPEHNAVFLSNIHGMPGVARVFAIPKMQKYPHRIMLADQEGLLDDFPQEKNMVTIFTLDENGIIESIKFWDPTSESKPF